MSDLATWLLAQLDADEAAARAATPGPWQAHTGRNRMASITVGEEVWVGDIDHDPDAAHIARHDPARVLAEVAAKRAIVEQAEGLRWVSANGDNILRALASVYEGAPGWQEEWR